jgi:hypothetical protein
MNLPDQTFDELHHLVNATIHELVMACKHAEDDQVEDAMQVLMTCQGNLDRAAELLLPFDATSGGGLTTKTQRTP